MARSITLARNAQYKNGDMQKTDTMRAFRLNKGIKLEEVFGDLIGVDPSHEYVEHGDDLDTVGYCLREEYLDENNRAGIQLTAANKLTYFEPSYRGGKGGNTTPAIPLTEKGTPNGVATLDTNGKVPLTELEIVKFNSTYGTIATTDATGEVNAVANWGNLEAYPKMLDNDRFYVVDTANNKNKVIDFKSLKEQIQGKCIRVPATGGVALTPNTAKDFLSGFGTELSSFTIYDGTGDIITNEVNIKTQAVGIDGLKVTSTVAVAGVYAILCTGLATNSTPATPNNTAITTNKLEVVGYKVKSIVEGVVSNEIELPCPIVGQLEIDTTFTTGTVQTLINPINYDVFNLIGADFTPAGWYQKNTKKLVYKIPTLALAPAGYEWKIDFNIYGLFQNNTASYRDSRKQQWDLSINGDVYSANGGSFASLFDPYISASLTVIGRKITSQYISLVSYISIDKIDAPTTKSPVRLSNNYKIYLAKKI